MHGPLPCRFLFGGLFCLDNIAEQVTVNFAKKARLSRTTLQLRAARGRKPIPGDRTAVQAGLTRGQSAAPQMQIAAFRAARLPGRPVYEVGDLDVENEFF